MLKAAIIIASLLVLTNANENESDEINCDCVFPQFCKGYTDGAHLLELRTIITVMETDECVNKLQICCNLDDIILPRQNDTIADTSNIQNECGGRNEKGVIFNLINQNLESQFGEFPWMIEISIAQSHRNDYNYLAGGSLIHPSVVLTAAHKVYDKNITMLRIRAGEWDQKSQNEPLPHQDRRVVRMVIHEQFKLEIAVNSVALLFLDEPFNIQKHINTVCLPPPDTSFDNDRCFVAGWGTDARTNGTERVNILKKIDVPVVPHEECEHKLSKTKFGDRFRLHTNLLCAGGEEGKDSCHGDGGSPLVCPIPNTVDRFYQAGIVIGGVEGCGVAEEPAVYAKITNYLDWIDSFTGSL